MKLPLVWFRISTVLVVMFPSPSSTSTSALPNTAVDVLAFTVYCNGIVPTPNAVVLSATMLPDKLMLAVLGALAPGTPVVCVPSPYANGAVPEMLRVIVLGKLSVKSKNFLPDDGNP